MVKRPIKHKQTSIKNKVALATFLSVSIVLICVSLSLFFYVHTLLRENIFQQQFTLVSEVADQLDGRITLARHQLALAATELNAKVLADPVSLEQALDHISAVGMIFDAGFLVIGSDGRVLAESMELSGLVGKDLSHRDYVQKPLRSGKPFISNPFRSILPSNSPLIAMSMPVRDDDDRIICLLVGYHNLISGQFLTALSSKGFGKGGYLFLLHDRTIIMHPDRTRILDVIDEGKNRGIDRAITGWEGSLDNVNSKGRHMISSFKRIGATDWILAANTPYEEAFAPLKKLELTTLLISAGGLLLSLLVVWYVTRRLTRPIEQLITHVDVTCRDISNWKPLELKTGDELERLAEAFNNMMDEIRQAEEALEQSARVYRIVAEYTSEIAFWRTMDNSMQFISANCFEITGYRDAEFYADHGLLDGLIHPDDREIWQHHLEDNKHEDTHAPVQIRILCKNGQTKWMAHACHKVRDESGQSAGTRGSFSDVTDTVLAQQRLRYEKVFVENLINSASTPIFVIDSRHRVQYWNRALEIVTGKTSAELKGTDRHWSGFYDSRRPTLADIILEGNSSLEGLYKTYSHSKYLEGGFQAEGWYSIGGQNRYLFFEAAPIRNKKGQVVASIETLADITERRLMEDSLSRLTRAVEQSPATIVMTDRQGAIEYVNPKFCQTTGYTAEEAIGQNPRVLKSGEMSAENYITLWKDISSGKEWRGEFHNKRKDGSLYWEFASISPLFDKDGLITGYLAVKEDITERKIVEMELQKAYTDLKEAQMQVFQQEKMASIGQLAAGVAHEINNPMGFISSNLATLNKYVDRLVEFIGASDQVLLACNCGTYADSLAEDRKRLKIDHVISDTRQLILESQDGAGRVRRIVEDLKNFSRVDQGMQELVNLNNILETTINIAWNEIKYVASINREFGEIPEVRCFPQQISQVFLNLLVNAGHAMEGRPGSITIRTWCEGEDVLISVADTGCGIPHEIKRRIFEPFFTTKEVGKGTGLGLSISYDIIRKHSGDITVESEAGCGTVFRVSLPLAGNELPQVNL
ncbi:MAG: PAS domain S-box protein [Geobacteraceae bacterium]|nr:PAS domain S-box protein [Geobacteraceae bacterium]